MSENYSPTTPPMSQESHLENVICMQSRPYLTTDHKNWRIVLSVNRKCVQTSALYPYFHAYNRACRQINKQNNFTLAYYALIAVTIPLPDEWSFEISICVPTLHHIGHKSGACSEEGCAKHVLTLLYSTSQKWAQYHTKRLARFMKREYYSDGAENIRFVHCPKATRHHIGRARACFKSFAINGFYSVNIEWIISRNVYKVVSAWQLWIYSLVVSKDSTKH